MHSSINLANEASIVRNSHYASMGDTERLVSMVPHLAEDIYMNQFWHAVNDREYGYHSGLRPSFTSLLVGAVRTERPISLLEVLADLDASVHRPGNLESLAELVVRLLNRVDSVSEELDEMLRFRYSDKMVHVCLDLLESPRQLAFS